MSRPISSQKNVSLDLQEGPTQKNLDEINAFTNSLKSNERIKISSGPGVTLVFTRYKESFPEQGLRRIGNFIYTFKAIRAFNNDQIHNAAINSEIYPLFRKANGAQHVMPELLKIHSHVSKKFHASDQPSISAKNFQSLTKTLAQKLSVPVFKNLQDSDKKDYLSTLPSKFGDVSIDSPQVNFMKGKGESDQKIVDEFKAFFTFVDDQINQSAGVYPDWKAVDFANRWKDFQSLKKNELIDQFGGEKNFDAISSAAVELLSFVKSASG
jgi:hypothetical protein